MREPRVSNIYFESAKNLLTPILNKRSSLEDKENGLHQIATAIGNCATPILDLLIQNYLGKQNGQRRGGKRTDNLNTLLQREALEKEIFQKLGNAVNEAGERIMPNLEKIEQVQALVNTIFLEGAAEFEDNMVKVVFPDGGPTKLPSKTGNISSGFKWVQPVLALAFAKLICRTDAEGTLETNANGRYVFDSQKMERIENKYRNALGDTTARETLAAKYLVDIQEILKKEENQVLFLMYKDTQI